MQPTIHVDYFLIGHAENHQRRGKGPPKQPNHLSCLARMEHLPGCVFLLSITNAWRIQVTKREKGGTLNLEDQSGILFSSCFLLLLPYTCCHINIYVCVCLIVASSGKTNVDVKVTAKSKKKKKSAEKIPVVPLDSPAMGTRSKKFHPPSPAMSTRSKRRLSLWFSSFDGYFWEICVNLHVLYGELVVMCVPNVKLIVMYVWTWYMCEPDCHICVNLIVWCISMYVWTVLPEYGINYRGYSAKILIFLY